MRSGWKLARLSDLLLKTETVDPTRTPNEPFTYIDVSSVSNTSFSVEETTQILGKAAPSRARRAVAAGDVIFATVRPTLQRVAIIPDHLDGSVCSTGYFVMRAGPQLDRSFLFHWLFSEEFRASMESLQRGASYPAVTDGNIRNQVIPLPPLEEQRRIVAVLDEAFAAIATATANAKKNVTNARELFSSELRQFFRDAGGAWEWTRIGEIADARLGKMLDKSKNKGTFQPYLRNLNVRWFRFDLSDLLEMRFEESEFVRYTAKRGDVLIVEGGYPGRAAIWDSDEPIFFQKALHRVRFDDPRLGRLLMYMLFAQGGDGTLAKHFSGAGIQHLTGQALARIPMPVPPECERAGIISKIEVLLSISEQGQELYEAKLAQLAALKQSLLRQAFSGELAVRETVAARPSNDNFATPEFAAQIVAFAYERHVAKKRVRNFGTVKAEKTLHMVEALGGIDLGRQPTRQAAGPDHAGHRHAVWDWARSSGFFNFVRRVGGGHDFVKLAAYDSMIDEARNAVALAGPSVVNAVELLVDTDTEFAELVATTYAAWNNLILDGCALSDDAIVYAARDGWHSDKLGFDVPRFHDAIRFIRKNDIVPDGSAKRVGGQEQLLL